MTKKDLPQTGFPSLTSIASADSHHRLHTVNDVGPFCNALKILFGEVQSTLWVGMKFIKEYVACIRRFDIIQPKSIGNVFPNSMFQHRVNMGNTKYFVLFLAASFGIVLGNRFAVKIVCSKNPTVRITQSFPVSVTSSILDCTKIHLSVILIHPSSEVQFKSVRDTKLHFVFYQYLL